MWGNLDILDSVEADQLEGVAMRDVSCPFELEIPELQLHLYSNTGANLEVPNIDNPQIWKFAWFCCFQIIHEGVSPILNPGLALIVWHNFYQAINKFFLDRYG